MRSLACLAVLLGATQLAGCDTAATPEDAATNNVADNAVPAAPAPATVQREASEPMETAPVPAMPEQTVIQSQPGSDGSQLDLLKVAVTGDILTVTLRCSSPEHIKSQTFAIKEISVIDDATSQRISVLKDNDGNWLAGRVVGNNIMTSCTIKPGIFWAKFAAPSAGTKTVSINLPEVAPFDGVPVTR